MSAYAATNTDRIVGNLIRFGRIVSVDHEAGTATVDFDGEIIEGLVWAVPRAGDDREYHAPSKDEQVCVLSPSGDLVQGVIAFSISQERFQNAGKDENPKTIYADGTVVEYNKQSHTLLIDASQSSGHVVIKCSSATVDSPDSTFTGNVTVGGSLNVAGASKMSGNVEFTGGSVKHGGKEIGSSHKHSGVQTGGGNTQGVV
ncbi:phage baseplate assembly protein V [Acinetobacter ursingii]|uniref:phage baseplate assembly protein V n=1 Tax=Acinetobacter ursingii TaxID=108980 RepID=UPI0021CD64EA|nr:phage baseplate assembly protein V [Acinetobacter ursingii]MCU4481353.1 phage baseplate assembly protein V [Acinetobacter ursingii]MCU4505685.1 phage baseplate assembly protein V [Acinetobacter ursingii]MCU4569631.1 phage baseplate assembly protein V [Acinetobacter ursingii]